MSRGWIGVDFDGTLADYQHMPEWDGSMGGPIPAMVERVKGWLAEGLDVRIFTARVSEVPGVTNGPRDVAVQRELIEAWCQAHIGRVLPVTATKDYHMRVLYDDRCVQVERNTGRLLGAEA